MSDTILEIYDNQLDYILGENGHFTSEAIYDPDCVVSLSSQTIYGIFDSITFSNTQKDDSGNVGQNAKAIFIVKDAPDDFDPYKNIDLKITRNGKTYKINNIDIDEEGAQTLWLV